jgi:GT2 family glycosyltransferase
MTEQATLNKTEQRSYGDKVSTFRFSECDIIIPFHGQYTKVQQVVQSILLFTKSNPYLLTLVDDASPNATFVETLRTQAPIRVLRNNEQKGFAGSLRVGFENTIKPWVVFMHSDCQVMDHYWLQRLGETALSLKSQNVRLIHARTDNPMTENPYLPSTPHEKACGDKIVETDEPLPLICAMVHRDLFKNIGGFLKEYPYGYYEDVELYYRMKRYGMRQAVCGRSWVHHDGGATLNEVIQKNKKAKLVIESNYDLCMKDIGR